MKTLRVLFLAVLAMALMVSGAFAADALPKDSFDVYINGKTDSAAKTTLSTDIVSPDAKTKSVSFDFTKAVDAGYTVSYDKTALFTVTSEDGKKVTLTFTPAAATTAGKFPFTFKFIPNDGTGDSSAGAVEIDSIKFMSTDKSTEITTLTLSADEEGATHKVKKVNVLVTLKNDYAGASLTGIKVAISHDAIATVTESALTLTGKGKTWSADITVTGKVSGDTYVKVLSNDKLLKSLPVEVRSKDAAAVATVEYYELTEAVTAVPGAAEATYYYYTDATATSGTTKLTELAVPKGTYFTAGASAVASGTKLTDSTKYVKKETSGNDTTYTYVVGDGSTEASTIWEERILSGKYAAAAGEAEYTLTFAFNYKIGSSTTTATASPDIALAEVSSLQEKTVTLYVSGDAKTFPVKLVVSPDYENADFSFDVDPAPSAWKFSVSGGTTSTKSGDNYAIPYTLTFTPSETKSQDKTYYTMRAYIVGSADISSSMKFYVEVLVSSDTTSGETTPEVSDAELAMEDPEVGKEELMQGEKTTVTITATPQAALGTYTFEYDDADEAFTITAGDEKQVSSVTGNAVEFTVQAGIEAEVGTHVVTFYVVSGDQEVSADVEFTVTRFDLSDMSDSEKAQYIKDNPAPKPTFGSETLEQIQAKFKDAIAKGEPVKFTMKSEWPVKATKGSKGWRMSFRRSGFHSFLMNLMRWLLGSESWTNADSATSAIAAFIASADVAGGIEVEIEDEYTANYTLKPDQAAAALTDGQTFSVQPAIIPAAYDDVEGVSDEDKASETDSIGDITGTNSSTDGGEQGGGDQGGGDQGGDDGKETIDNLLGGTSGGCDAGFGALALALAATLFLGKKRS